jgi:hypothetical protein
VVSLLNSTPSPVRGDTQYKVLTKIQDVLDDPEMEDAQRKHRLIELSNQFYTYA